MWLILRPIVVQQQVPVRKVARAHLNTTLIIDGALETEAHAKAQWSKINKSIRKTRHFRTQWYFIFQNCSDLLLWEKIVLVLEKNLWNSRVKAENLQKIMRFLQQFILTGKQNAILTYSWRFLWLIESIRKIQMEKILGFRKLQKIVRSKYFQ